MAKRFTDTEKWKKGWFCSLSPEMKLLWVYILDNCDSAGLWDINFGLAEYQIGIKLDVDKIKKVFKKQYIKINDNKWFIRDFIEFQYKCSLDNLNVLNKAHLPIIATIKKYNLQGALKGLRRGLEAPLEKDKEKDLDKDKDKEKDKDKDINIKDNITSQEIYSYYSKTIKPGAKEDAIKNITKLLKTGVYKEELLGRIDAYKVQIIKERTKPGFYIQANNFFGEKARYKDFEPIKPPTSPKADPNCNICQGKGRIPSGSQKGGTCLCVK